MPPAEQADRHPLVRSVDRFDRLGQVGVGMKDTEQGRLGTVGHHSEETVQPTRRSWAYAVHRLTGAIIRPRKRRSGLRSPSGGRKGWSLWMVTGPVLAEKRHFLTPLGLNRLSTRLDHSARV